MGALRARVELANVRKGITNNADAALGGQFQRFRFLGYRIAILALVTNGHLRAVDAFATKDVAGGGRLPMVSSLPSFMTAEDVAPVAPEVGLPAIVAINEDSRSSVPQTLEQERRIRQLDSALQANATAASALLTELTNLRKSGSQEEVDRLIDGLLSVVDGDDSSKRPLWVRIRPLAMFSRRARRASLCRVLDMSTPTSQESDADGDDTKAARRRRSRSLIMVLQTLAASEDDEIDGNSAPVDSDKVPVWRLRRSLPRIVAVERAARRDAKADVTVEDMANRLPPGLETPKYTVLARRPSLYEVRRYDAYSVCTVPMNRPLPVDASKTDARISNPQLSGASSFGALAGYLFGKNDKSISMKMTTPVLMTGEGDSRQMSFVMPSDYWDGNSVNSAPKPLDGSGVFLERDAGGERAVIMFSGLATKGEVEKKKQQLLEHLKTDKEWQPLEGFPVSLAQYNDPFTPPWKRRNEVSVPVAAKTTSS